MTLTDAIDRLAAFEPAPFPVISLYLDARPDATGRHSFGPFLRRAFKERERTWRAGSPEHESFTRDAERIARYIDRELQPSANGVAIFACAGADGYFEALQLDAPIDEHRLFVDDRPHLYPLARLDDQYPRYAAVLANTNVARILAFSTGRVERREQVQGVKTKRSKVGGWSQARFQRHVEHFHDQHVKELVDALDAVVRQERVSHVLLAGDAVVLPLIREHLPPHLEALVADVLSLDIGTNEREVLTATLEALRQKDAETDEWAVARLMDAARGEGLGVLGAEATLEALTRGQADEVLMTTRPDLLANAEHLVPDAAPHPVAHTGSIGAGLAAVDEASTSATPASGRTTVPPLEKAADEIVTRARQTGARVRFIEDAALLAEVGGVGATLRFRL